MKLFQQIKTAGLSKNQLSVYSLPVSFGQRMQTFLLSFGLTLALTGLLAGWSVTGYRCRMISNPPTGESLVCDIRSDYIRIRLPDWDFSLRIEVIPLR